VYDKHDWIGDELNNYIGARIKASHCHKEKSNVKILLFFCESVEKVKYLKDLFRKEFKLGKNSIHITDTHEETVDICKFMLNRNGINFLNKSKLEDRCYIDGQIKQFKIFLDREQVSKEDVAISSGAVLNLFGLRRSHDIDFIVSPSYDLENIKNLDCHNQYKNYFEESLEDLIYNPKNYFWYSGLKILTPEIIFKFKQNRNEPKDKIDMKLLMSIISEKKLPHKHSFAKKIKFTRMRLNLRIYVFITNILITLNLVDYIKKIMQLTRIKK